MFSLKVLLLISIASVAWCVPADEKNEKPAEAPKEQKDAGKPVAQHAHFLREYGDQDSKANERGYHRTSEDQGDDGYKHFDSFHKKNSDKYGHEHHSAFGKSKKSKNRVSASNAKYDDKEPHEAAASRRIFHFSSPWSSGTSLPHIIGFDIEALANKFDYRGHRKHRFYHRRPEFYHDHHSHDIEYDHPPIEHDSYHHSPKSPSHGDVPEELDHPPSSYEHEHHETPHSDHDDSKELDHPPPGYENGDSPPDHVGTKELDHPPPGYENGDKYHGDSPPDHAGAEELDHPPPGYENGGKPHGDSPPDHAGAEELDHPPSGYENGDKHHGDSPPDHAGAEELDHPPPGYENGDKHHADLPPDHADSKELDHPPPDNGSHNDEKPPGGDFDAKELDHPPPGYETDGQDDAPPSTVEADDRKFNLQSQISGLGDKKLPAPSRNYLPNFVSGNGKNPTQFSVSNQHSHQNKNIPISVQNGVYNPQYLPIQPQVNNGNAPVFNQSNSGTLIDDSLSSSVMSIQANKEETLQNNANIGATDSKNQFVQSSVNISSNQKYLPPYVGPNNNYKIFFGGFTKYDYPKPYYDVDHWEKSLQNLKSNASSTSTTSEVATASNATEQKETTGERIKGTQSSDMLKDSYGNRYIPIDLKKYLPPLPEGNSAGGNVNPEISGNDGIFYGEHYIPEEYFGGKFEQDMISQNGGGSGEGNDDLNVGKVSGEVAKDVGSGNMGEGTGNNVSKMSGEVVNGNIGKEAGYNAGKIDGKVEKAVEDGNVSKEAKKNDGMYFGAPFINSNQNVVENLSGRMGGKVKSSNVASMRAMQDSFVKVLKPIMQNYYLPPYEINNIILAPTKSNVKRNTTLEEFNGVFGKSGPKDGASVKDSSVVGSGVEDKKSHNHEGRS